jgi:hypothetical protein
VSAERDAVYDERDDAYERDTAYDAEPRTVTVGPRDRVVRSDDDRV